MDKLNSRYKHTEIGRRKRCYPEKHPSFPVLNQRAVLRSVANVENYFRPNRGYCFRSRLTKSTLPGKPPSRKSPKRDKEAARDLVSGRPGMETRLSAVKGGFRQSVQVNDRARSRSWTSNVRQASSKLQHSRCTSPTRTLGLLPQRSMQKVALKWTRSSR